MIEEARARVEETGGHSLTPRLRETAVRLRARADPNMLTSGLRKVEAMYRSLGALGHADRLLGEVQR